MSQAKKFFFRVVTIGEESVGKTSLSNKLIGDGFNPYEQSTVGASYHQFSELIEGNEINIQIWDTAGQEKFRSIVPMYFRNASAAIAVFDIGRKSTYKNIGGWIKQFLDVVGDGAFVYIAANKCDLVDEMDVDLKEAREWAEKNKFKFFETSAKNGKNVKMLSMELAHDLYLLSSSKIETTTKEREEKKCC